MKVRHPDARRLLAELAALYVQCDDCGHRRRLGLPSFSTAQAHGLQTYEDLCRKLRCSECPKQRLNKRNLTLAPTWRDWSVAVA